MTSWRHSRRVPALLSFVRRSRVERPCASQAGSTSGRVAEQAPTLTAGGGAGQVAPLGRKDARPDLSWVQAAAAR